MDTPPTEIQLPDPASNAAPETLRADADAPTITLEEALFTKIDRQLRHGEHVAPPLLSEDEKLFAPDERFILKALRAFKDGLDATEIQNLVKRAWRWPRLEAALVALYQRRLIYPTVVRKGNRWTVTWHAGAIEDAIKTDALVAVLGEPGSCRTSN